MDPNALTLSSEEAVGASRGRPRAASVSSAKPASRGSAGQQGGSSKPSSSGAPRGGASSNKDRASSRDGGRSAPRASSRDRRGRNDDDDDDDDMAGSRGRRLGSAGARGRPPPSREQGRGRDRDERGRGGRGRDGGSRGNSWRDEEEANNSNAPGSMGGTASGHKGGFDDEVLEWLDASPRKKSFLYKSRTQDYSRKWYRRAVGSTSFVLFWTHLIYVITQLVTKAHFSYFHVINWIGTAIFFIGGMSVWTYKTAYAMQPKSVHSVTQFYFVALFLYLFVGIIAWFINLFRVRSLVERYCRESQDGECPTGTTQQGLQGFVVIGLLLWFVFFIYMYGTIARFSFLYLCTIERHYYGNPVYREQMRMWLIVALLGRNLCLLSKTLNFLCCQSCTPRVLGKPGDPDAESSYTEDVMVSSRRRGQPEADEDEDDDDEQHESASSASEQAERYNYEEDEEEDNGPKGAHYALPPPTDHGSPNGYLCSWCCCFIICYISLVACYASVRTGMLSNVGCFVYMMFEPFM